MVVPLMLGALLNTIDQAHFTPVESAMKWLGATPVKVERKAPLDGRDSSRPLLGPQGAGPSADGAKPPVKTVVEEHYEFLRIGSFTEALGKNGALCLIGLFLFCAGAQMNLRVAGKALKKGVLTTGSKYAVGVAVGYAMGALLDPMHGLLGLSTMAVIAAMTNSNGGMYAALAGQYGNRSDVGALSVLSLNDGPFFTLVALGLLGEQFPAIAFLAVLVPIAIGMALGNLDGDVRRFLKPGESILIPFFAFALGLGMDFRTFLNPSVLAGGLLLGAMTVLFSAAAGILVFRLFRERSQIAVVSEASTAGNAVATPKAIAVASAAAAAAAAEAAANDPALADKAAALAHRAAQYASLVDAATAQVSISTLTTAILCPLLVIFWSKYQRSRGIDARAEDYGASESDP
jgi:2-keto-3-deoxygluconate permease